VGESEGKGVGGRRKRRVKSKGMQMVRSGGGGDVWGDHDRVKNSHNPARCNGGLYCAAVWESDPTMCAHPNCLMSPHHCSL
jgi:hypothetical protein